MKILVISQVFWPDTAATAQQLADLTAALVNQDYEVDVFCSRFAYEDPGNIYPSRADFKGVKIFRLRSSGFGKRTKLGRAVDFLSFNLSLFFRLLSLKKRSYEVMLGMTSPPLISFFGILVSRMKGFRFIYWTMDLQPELSLAAGYLKANGRMYKILQGIGDYIFRRADLIITLDKYMRDHIKKRTGRCENIVVIPVWPVMETVYSGDRLDNPFRKENDFGDRYVIMYSGNHSVMHPLDTLLNTALYFRDDSRFLFVFIGEGVRKKDVSEFKEQHRMENIMQLPYQPREKIHLSLGAADIQAVVQGSACTGYTHPNKIYGAMFIGCPILYIGPRPTHITDILDNCPGNLTVNHGEAELLHRKLLDFYLINPEELKLVRTRNREFAEKNFPRSKLINEMVENVNRLAKT